MTEAVEGIVEAREMTLFVVSGKSFLVAKVVFKMAFRSGAGVRREMRMVTTKTREKRMMPKWR